MEPQIDDEPQMLEPGPSDGSLLTRQPHHRSEDIWNGDVKYLVLTTALIFTLSLTFSSREHNYVRRILYNVAGLRADPAATGQANNRTETKLATTAALVISTAPVTTPTHGRHDTASPSTSAARGSGQPATVSPSTSAARGRGRPATVSPSISAARGRGRPATASPSTSATRGRGRCATTVSEVPPPMVDVSPQAEVPSPTPPSQPSPLTPPMHPETPLYPATSSNALTLPMDPPRTEPMTMIPTPGLYIEHHYPLTSSSSDPLGPPVGIDMLQSDIDVSDEHPPHQPSPPRGRPQRARRAPICGTGGHKIGHKGSSMHDDEPKADAPQPPPSPKHYTRRLLVCISNGKLAEDRRSAMIELQAIVAESRGAQLAFGAMGFPVMLAVLKEERDDVEMVENLSSPYIFIPCFSFNFNSITQKSTY
nr:golgin candidate 6 [Quercus suber]